MTELRTWIGLATLLGALGLWLALPRGAARGRRLGALLALAAVALIGWLVAPPAHALGDYGGRVVFYVLAAVTVISAAAAISFRSPVYCAIWFALSLLGAAGLFLFQGAQFLGVATVVVYAGAILVTFLFVLMLAQPHGDAFYDRISWEGSLSAGTGALLIGVLTLTIVGVLQNGDEETPPAMPFTAAELDGGILAQEHVARLGGQLFSRYLIGIEIAGTLLLVALVGAVAIVAQAGRLAPQPKSTELPRLDPRIVSSREPNVTTESSPRVPSREEVARG